MQEVDLLVRQASTDTNEPAERKLRAQYDHLGLGAWNQMNLDPSTNKRTPPESDVHLNPPPLVLVPNQQLPSQPYFQMVTMNPRRT